MHEGVSDSAQAIDPVQEKGRRKVVLAGAGDHLGEPLARSLDMALRAESSHPPWERLAVRALERRLLAAACLRTATPKRSLSVGLRGIRPPSSDAAVTGRSEQREPRSGALECSAAPGHGQGSILHV